MANIQPRRDKSGRLVFYFYPRFSRAERKEANYLQPADIDAINAALRTEPLKWQALVHLLMITGARRGEVLGLKWEDVDFARSRVFICRSISYTPDKGVYEGRPKTKSSERYIAIPPETISMLKDYRVWQLEERFRLGEIAAMCSRGTMALQCTRTA